MRVSTSVGCLGLIYKSKVNLQVALQKKIYEKIKNCEEKCHSWGQKLGSLEKGTELECEVYKGE